METDDPGTARRRSLPVLYEDHDLVVVDKPSGMIVHRGWARDDEDALRCVRDQLGARVYPVHRLDRGTSGVLVFARRPDVASVWSAAFAEGRVRKTYLALVRGHLTAPIDLDHPVRRGEDGPRVPARTRFEPIARSAVERCSWVRAIPLTGRTHQIRRHLKHLSHPIVGDVRYGKGDVNRRFRTRWNLHRLALHAARLEAELPDREALDVSAPLPADLAATLASLELAVAS